MSNQEPVVSICCIAYKHEKFIRECLDGFVMQKTNFPFEVIVHDDASPDKTADIIREYEEKYPDIIKPIYQTQNQFSQKIKPLWEYVFPRARGKYMAICEGDDFWCDPGKLQMQYDFMESHPDYSLCMHGKYVLDHFNKYLYSAAFVKNFPENGTDFARRIALGEYLFSTQTMFIRKSCFDAKFDEIYRDSRSAPMSDLQIAFHLALSGKIKCIERRMAVYRRAPNSMTNNAVGSRKDFNQKAVNAVCTMLENSGFPQWAKERIKLSGREKTINFFIYPLRLANAFLRRFCLLPRYIFARRQYNEYMSKTGLWFE